MKLFAASILILFLVIGCAYPSSDVRVTDERPKIAVKNAPSDAVVYVDGLRMGLASKFNGEPGVLLLEPGRHKIEIKSGSRTLLSEDVFLGESALKTFVVN
jgi:hypothetical protein